MDKLIEFLRDENARISFGDKWLCVSGEGEDVKYTVYQRKYGAKKTTELYFGIILGVALAYLSGEIQ